MDGQRFFQIKQHFIILTQSAIACCTFQFLIIFETAISFKIFLFFCVAASWPPHYIADRKEFPMTRHPLRSANAEFAPWICRKVERLGSSTRAEMRVFRHACADELGSLD